MAKNSNQTVLLTTYDAVDKILRTLSAVQTAVVHGDGGVPELGAGLSFVG